MKQSSLEPPERKQPCQHRTLASETHVTLLSYGTVRCEVTGFFKPLFEGSLSQQQQKTNTHLPSSPLSPQPQNQVPHMLGPQGIWPWLIINMNDTTGEPGLYIIGLPSIPSGALRMSIEIHPKPQPYLCPPSAGRRGDVK